MWLSFAHSRANHCRHRCRCLIDWRCILGYYGYGSTVGHITLAATMLATILTIAIALRSKTWKRFMLDTSIDGSIASTDDENQVKPGDEGMTISRLTPMGKARFNDRIYEVKSTESMLIKKLK